MIQKIYEKNQEGIVKSGTNVADQTKAFGEILSEGIKTVNDNLTDFESLSKDFASGKPVNVHELMLKGEKADMSLKMFVALKSKVVDAYSEVMRMNV